MHSRMPARGGGFDLYDVEECRRDVGAGAVAPVDLTASEVLHPSSGSAIFAKAGDCFVLEVLLGLDGELGRGTGEGGNISGSLRSSKCPSSSVGAGAIGHCPRKPGPRTQALLWVLLSLLVLTERVMVRKPAHRFARRPPGIRPRSRSSGARPPLSRLVRASWRGFCRTRSMNWRSALSRSVWAWGNLLGQPIWMGFAAHWSS